MVQSEGRRKPHAIEWCTHTANPFTGCTHGCGYCYARAAARRWSHNKSTVYHRLADAGVDPFMPAFSMKAYRALEQELRRARVSRRVFLGSMSDISCRWPWIKVPDEGPIDALQTMDRRQVVNLIRRLAAGIGWKVDHVLCLLTKEPDGLAGEWPGTPLRGIWVGVSAETAEAAMLRVSTLLHLVKAPVRWLSLEPLAEGMTGDWMIEGLEQGHAHELDWIVIGAQTGPGAPPPNVRAAKKVVEWAHTKGVPCFVKKNMRQGDTSVNWPMEYPKGGSK